MRARGWSLLGAAFALSCSEAPSDDSPSAVTDSDPRPKVVTLGTSLTHGYGLPPESAWPALLQEKVDAEGWELDVVNAGQSGDTAHDGATRLNWVLRGEVAAVVLELGANDALRGLSAESLETTLKEIVQRIRTNDPSTRIVLAGMKAPPNLGTYREAFDAVFPRVAQDASLALVPFLLEGVGGEPTLNLPDGIHPNEDGHRIVAETVWATLRPELAAWIDGAERSARR